MRARRPADVTPLYADPRAPWRDDLAWPAADGDLPTAWCAVCDAARAIGEHGCVACSYAATLAAEVAKLQAEHSVPVQLVVIQLEPSAAYLGRLVDSEVARIEASRAPAISRIRRGRELAGLTMGQAARLLGIDLVQLSAFETGAAAPTQPQLNELAECYGVTVSWLAGGAPVDTSAIAKAMRDADVPAAERDSIVELLGAMRPRAGGGSDGAA